MVQGRGLDEPPFTVDWRPPQEEHRGMLTTYVLNRVFQIRFRDYLGTAFTIEEAGRQYLVTAKHVVDGLTTGGELLMMQKEQWRRMPVRWVWYPEDGAD